jgi:hypothetical protein
MSGQAVLIAGLVWLIAICGLAVIKGGPAERLAAYMIGGAWLAAILARFIFGKDHLELIALSNDAVLSLGLLMVSIRYASLWLGFAMLLQSSAFALHAWYLADPPADQNGYIWAINNLSYAVLLTLLVATLTTWFKRRRRNAAPADPLPAAA